METIRMHNIREVAGATGWSPQWARIKMNALGMKPDMSARGDNGLFEYTLNDEQFNILVNLAKKIKDQKKKRSKALGDVS